MRIGIVQHFKVNCKAKRMMNSSNFEEYITNHDNSPVIENKIDLEYS